jgi:transposase-like protein
MNNCKCLEGEKVTKKDKHYNIEIFVCSTCGKEYDSLNQEQISYMKAKQEMTTLSKTDLIIRLQNKIDDINSLIKERLNDIKMEIKDYSEAKQSNDLNLINYNLHIYHAILDISNDIQDLVSQDLQ